MSDSGPTYLFNATGDNNPIKKLQPNGRIGDVKHTTRQDVEVFQESAETVNRD